MQPDNLYLRIDLKETGRLLEKLIRKNGYSVKDIQNMLHLSCPQPIYRWMKGQVLPSVDHLFVLAGVLDVHMEELLVPVYGALWECTCFLEWGVPSGGRYFSTDWMFYQWKQANVME